jgi:tRNA (guanosine-2'-O-)-methyltransferase
MTTWDWPEGYGMTTEQNESMPALRVCPHHDPFGIGGESFTADEVIETLTEYVSDERQERIRQVLAERTYSVTPVMDGLCDRGNVSAVLRSAEALGCQSAHIIETAVKFKYSKRTAQGASKWLDIRRWESSQECAEHLKGAGYHIVAAHFENASPIDEMAFDQPTALILGNEREGISEAMLAHADASVIVPMAGFTRSFNISVAAALCLYHIRQARCARFGRHGDLTPDEIHKLTAVYYLQSVDSAEKILIRKRGDRETGG